MKTLDTLEDNVVQWAINKGIMGKATPVTQMYKMQEEVDELLCEVGNEDRDKILMELGDVLVTCCIQASMWNTSIGECLGLAYNKISKRTGEMKNGVFVKDEV